MTLRSASYIEFAQMFRRFGAEVTIVEKNARLVSHEDEDVSAEIRAFLEAEGTSYGWSSGIHGFISSPIQKQESLCLLFWHFLETSGLASTALDTTQRGYGSAEG